MTQVVRTVGAYSLAEPGFGAENDSRSVSMATGCF